jgi:hypothetical protein
VTLALGFGVGLACGTSDPPGGNGKGKRYLHQWCVGRYFLYTLCIESDSASYWVFVFFVFCAQFGKWWYRHVCAIGGDFNTSTI